MINKNTMVNMLNIAIVKLLKILVSSKLQHHAKTKKLIKFQATARRDRRTDRPYFIGHFQLLLGVQK